jgi:hypothetical protein
MDIKMIHYYCVEENSHLLEALSNKLNIIVKSIFDDNIKNVLISIRNFNHIGMIVFDVKAFMKNTETEISDGLISLRTGYMGDLVVVANGYDENSLFIQKIRQSGIKHIIFADKKITDSLICIIEDKEEIPVDLEVVCKTEVKEKRGPPLIKTNKKIKIGVCGSLQRIGATHHAISITKYLCDNNQRACYIEANDHNEVKYFADWIDNVKIGKNYYEYNNIKMYCHSVTNSEMMSKPYNYYIYDFGELEEINFKSFNACNIKIIITGGKPWELMSYGKLYANNTGLSEVYTTMNFVPDSSKAELSQMFKETKLCFSEYSPDMFNTLNDEIYNKILEDYDKVNKE